jgi:hypothetical protein
MQYTIIVTLKDDTDNEFYCDCEGDDYEIEDTVTFEAITRYGSGNIVSLEYKYDGSEDINHVDF